MDLFTSIYSQASHYFKSDHLRQAFTFQSMYLGMSPFTAPATYNLLQGTEFLEGVWYPRGGFHQLITSLEKIAKEKFKVTFRLNCPIRRISIGKDGKTVDGVILNDGSLLKADLVISNVDTIFTYEHLLPSTRYGRRLGNHSNLTCSSISFYWSMKKRINCLAAHNVFLASEYEKSFKDIFQEHMIPSELSFYIHVPSRLDETAAPPGKDSLTILVATPHLGIEKNQREEEKLTVTWVRSRVLKRLKEQLDIDLAEWIENEEVMDRVGWQKEFNLFKGSILGLSHTLDQVLYFRPSLKCKQFKNLYFVGASYQPGTGVPVVLCGARLLALHLQQEVESGLREGWETFAFIIFLALGFLVSILFFLINYFA